MSKLNIDQQTIKELFANKRSDFLIPDYQRPYAWGEDECQTLWDDIFVFAFPENDCSKFNSDEDEYFLGPIVTFKNEQNKLEIIDGQQRLTTLMLLLRAFFSKFGNMKDANAISTSDDIAKCIWKTDEFGNPDKNKLKINSEVSTDDDKKEFFLHLMIGENLCRIQIFSRHSSINIIRIRAKKTCLLGGGKSWSKFVIKYLFPCLVRQWMSYSHAICIMKGRGWV